MAVRGVRGATTVDKNTEEDIKKMCKGAEIAPGLAIRGSKAVISEYMVACWAKEQTGMPV